MEEFVNFSSFEYSGNLHSTNNTNNSDDEKDNGQTITLETEDVEEEIDESEQIALEIDKNLNIPIAIDDEQCAQYH